jgi:hypothetical protein
MKKHTRRQLQAAAGFVIAAVFLYFAVHDVDFNVILEQLAGINLVYLPACLILYALFFYLKAVRWSWLLRPVRQLSVKEVCPALMIGFMGNNVLPAHLGEFVRMYVLSRQYDMKKSSVFSTIVLERILDFLVITANLALVLQFIPLSDDLKLVRTGGIVVGAGSLSILLFFLFFVWKTETTLQVMEKLLTPLPRGLRNTLLTHLRAGAEGLYSLRSGRLLAATLLLTAFHWMLNASVLYLACISFPSENEIPLTAGLLLLSVCALGVTLPTAPGFFGTMQFCFRISLAVFGVGSETAFTASMYALLIGYIPVTLLGFYFLGRLGMNLSTIKEEADKEDEYKPPA